MKASPLIGCIADDFTGGTDIAGMFVANGLSAIQMIGIPARRFGDIVGANADVVVIALKSRTAPVEEAVARALAALAWLREAGCRQIYFKYCSTFDSTPEGNIGPVAEALMEALGAETTIFCPAFPANGRTVYQGHLFVADQLLGDSGMRHHPLTPMTDSNILRLLAPQTCHRAGLIDHSTIRKGTPAIASALDKARVDGLAHMVVDTLDDDDLVAIAGAVADMPLVTGGSGLAIGLARHLAGEAAGASASNLMPGAGGSRAVIAGSCSTMTRRQVAAMRARHPSFHIRAEAVAEGQDVVAGALDFARAHLDAGPVLIHATDEPDAVAATQASLGVKRAGDLVEGALADIACGLVKAGVRQMIVAGGETSGAVVRALGVEGLRIGPNIVPGVPWTDAIVPSGPPLALALKSGNFGAEDFFLTAWNALRAQQA